MLENRPITEKALIAGGAFAFIFGAAMAGSAFMITGGFGWGEDRASGPAPSVVTVWRDSISDWTSGDAWARPQATPVSYETDATFEQTAAEGLAGGAGDDATRPIASEEEILASIERDIAAMEAESAAREEAAEQEEAYAADPWPAEDDAADEDKAKPAY